jgi:hypothetical protein
LRGARDCSSRPQLGAISSSRCQKTRAPRLRRAKMYTSGRVNQRRSIRWWSQTGSNRRPPACKAGALPTELWPLFQRRQTQVDRRTLARRAKLARRIRPPSPFGFGAAAFVRCASELACQSKLAATGPPSLKELRRAAFAPLRERRLVGLGRLELPTSRLSSARSNQLSYKPEFRIA